LKRLPFILKVAVSLGLVALIALRADWEGTARTLARASLPLLALVLAVMISGILLSAFRWGLLLRALEVFLPFRELQRYYFTGMFFNNFLPTSVGGDAYRVLRTRAPSGSATALSAVLVERLTGVAAMVLLAWCLAVLDARGGEALSAELGRWGGLALLAGLGGGILALALLRRREPAEGGRRGWLAALAGRLLAFRRRPGSLLPALLLSLVFHLFMAWGIQLLFLALGAEISFARAFIVMALSQLIGLIPVSLNGLGLSDGALIYVASLYGVPDGTGLGAALVTRLFMMLISLHGGLLYLRESLRAPPAST
jgi:uncharacterized membrane protein YbhN (UPF0104 family)